MLYWWWTFCFLEIKQKICIDDNKPKYSCFQICLQKFKKTREPGSLHLWQHWNTFVNWKPAMTSFDKFPEAIYLSEASFLSSLQDRLSPLSDFLIPVSSIGDPSKGFIIYFPLILAINYLKGIKFLGAFIVSEWINMVCFIEWWSYLHLNNHIMTAECQVDTARREAVLVD